MPTDLIRDPCQSLRRTYVKAGEALDAAHAAARKFSPAALRDDGKPHYVDPTRMAAAKKRVDTAKAAFVTAQIALAECTALQHGG